MFQSNFYRNFIGFCYLNHRKLKDKVLSEHYSSHGIEHLAIALEKSDRLLEVDLSANNIGSENFSLLQSVFAINLRIELLNLDNCFIDGN